MPTVSDKLIESAAVLANAGVAEPHREAASLLAFALRRDRTFLIAHPEHELSVEEENRFLNVIERRANREPFHYIVGKKEFFGLEFFVTRDVLIPRPETEVLAEIAIKQLEQLENPRFCEVGIGSGCISVSILHNTANSSGVGLDISIKALDVARQNAEKHGVADRLRLDYSDIFSALSEERFDLIVSNPPYVTAADIPHLQVEVREFEPLIALTDGGGGLSIIEKIITSAPNYLKPRGFLLLEIGFDQAECVKEMYAAEIWRDVHFIVDIQGIRRSTVARLA